MLFLIIVLLSALGQVAADLYVSTMPAIGNALQLSITAVQTTLPLYLVGYAFSQIFWGPLSDGIGRKIPLISGLTLLIIGTLLCALAGSLAPLLFGRFLQGLGGACAVTLSRSILRDQFEGITLARFSSYLAFFSTMIMAAAPFIGALLFQMGGWRFPFIFLFFFGIFLLMHTLFSLPETNIHKKFERLSPKNIKKILRTLSDHPEYYRYLCASAFAYAPIMGWLTAGPILIIEQYQGDEITFGSLSLIVGIAYGIGGLLNGILLSRIQRKSLIQTGQWIMGGSGFFLFIFSNETDIKFLMIPLMFSAFGAGAIFPNCLAGALSPFAKNAGLAGSFYGFSQILGGLLGSLFISYFQAKNLIPLSLLYMFTSILGVLIINKQ